MSVDKKLCFILSTLCFVVVCNAEVDYFDTANRATEDLLDPHSFHYDKHTRTENRPPGQNDNHAIGEWKSCDAAACYRALHKCKSGQNKDVPDELFSRRFMNMLLSRSKFEKDGLYLTGRVELIVTPAQFEALKKFGLGNLSLREADTILNNAIQSPPWDPIHESAVWFQTVAGFIREFVWLYQDKMLMGIGLVVLLYLCYSIKGSRYSFWILITISFQLILVVSFFTTWWKLIQEAKIKHQVLQMKHVNLPIQCQPHKMGWFDTITSWFVTDDCEKYFEAMMRDPLLQVTPAEAMAHMLSAFMFVPMELGGKTIGKFLENVTAHMPFWLSYTVQIGICLGFFPTMIIIILLLAGGSTSLGFGPWSIFSLMGPGNSQPIRNSVESASTRREPIEVILNVVTNGQVTSVTSNPTETSHNLAITNCESCSKKEEKKGEKDSQPAAGGDSELTSTPGTSQQSDNEEIKDGVRRRKNVEVGSGDH